MTEPMTNLFQSLKTENAQLRQRICELEEALHPPLSRALLRRRIWIGIVVGIWTFLTGGTVWHLTTLLRQSGADIIESMFIISFAVLIITAGISLIGVLGPILGEAIFDLWKRENR